MLLVLHLEEAYRFPGGNCLTGANIRGKCPVGANVWGANVLRGQMSYGGECPGADVLGTDVLRGECPGGDVHGGMCPKRGKVWGQKSGGGGADVQGASVLIQESE